MQSITREPARATAEKAAAAAELAWRAWPDKEEEAYAYAQLLFTLGDFRKAWSVLRPHAESASPSERVLSLAGRLTLLLGMYDRAVEINKLAL